MKKYFYSLFLLIGFLSCTSSEIKLPDSAKSADNYSRQFISYIIDGQVQSATNMMSPEVISNSTNEYLTNANKNLNHEIVKKINPVEYALARTSSSSGKVINYQLAYEYSFDKGNVLFLIKLRENGGNLSITSFEGTFLQAPLSELTQFSLSGKSFTHYIFLICFILILLFIVGTFIMMLREKMSVKKKIMWAFIILLISLPRFIINWNTGDVGFIPINFSLLGVGFNRPTLYSDWILTFNVPIGAILYWLTSGSRQRKRLETEVNSTLENMTES